MLLLETERLSLRSILDEDAAFMLDLLNQPSWLKYIGDHGVSTLEQARRYIANGPRSMHAQYGYALSMVVRKADACAIGVCGLVQRESLPDADLGFAFLPQFCGQGYAHEAAAACLQHGHQVLHMARILALTLPSNQRSMRLLERLGFDFLYVTRLSADDPEVKLYSHT